MSIEERIKEALGADVSGQCYVASECLYHLMGGQASGLIPIQGNWEGISHWALKSELGWVIDLTVEQFEEVPDYSLFRGRGFLTKNPSKRAQLIIDKVKGN